MSRRHHWTVLTPVFEDRDSFAQLCRDIAEAGQGLDLRICAVDDGSVTAPPDLRAISDVGLQGEVIRLRRNVGHQMAIAIGLNHLAMDDDLDRANDLLKPILDAKKLHASEAMALFTAQVQIAVKRREFDLAEQSLALLARIAGEDDPKVSKLRRLIDTAPRGRGLSRCLSRV